MYYQIFCFNYLLSSFYLQEFFYLGNEASGGFQKKKLNEDTLESFSGCFGQQ